MGRAPGGGTCPASEDNVASLVLFFLLLAASPAPAQPAGGAKAAVAPAGDSRTIVGEIVWVDLPTHLVLIRESVKTTKVQGQPPARQTVAVSVAPDVPVTRGRKPVTLSDLKAKDHVTARYVSTPRGAKAILFRVAEAGPRRAVGTPATGDAPSPSGGN